MRNVRPVLYIRGCGHGFWNPGNPEKSEITWNSREILEFQTLISMFVNINYSKLKIITWILSMKK